MQFYDYKKYKKWQDTQYKVSSEISNKFAELTNKKNIVIMGDYDVDGTTAAYVAKQGLQRIHPDSNVQTIIPKRFTEGYGICDAIVSNILDSYNPSDTAIVTVDNGITQPALTKLYDAGFSVVITDHHLAEDKTQIPKAHLIIDAHVDANGIDYVEYCGCGIIYKVLSNLTDMSDLRVFAGIATIADVMPLTEDNWKLAGCAMRDINNNKMPPAIRGLIQSRPCEYVEEEFIKMELVPLINAMSRMNDDGGTKIVEYFENPDESKAFRFFEENNARKTATAKAVEQAMQYISENNLQNKSPIWLNIDDVDGGVIGLVASKIAERFCSPCICISNGHGSARSFGDFDMYDYLSKYANHLLAFGGHAGACGLSVADNEFEFLSKQTQDKPKKTYSHPKPDIMLAGEDIAKEYANTRDYAPFGEGNPSALYGINIDPKRDRISTFGNKGQYARINGNITSFNDNFGGMSDNKFVVVGTLGLNYFFNKATPQFYVAAAYKDTDRDNKSLTLNRTTKDIEL